MIALILLLSGCNEYDLTPGHGQVRAGDPAIEVVPRELDFGVLSAGQTAELTFTIHSVGAVPVLVDDLWALGAGFTVLDTAEFSLPPGQTRDIRVRFTPMGADAQSGVVPVLSDDPDAPELPVSLLGAGRVPELVISPDPWDFGEVPIPCAASVPLQLENVGNDALVIEDLDYASDGQLTLGGAPTWTLDPGAKTTVWVRLAPAVAGPTEGGLTVRSNDPRGALTASQRASPYHAGERLDAFTVPTDPPVDLLFAIDRSCSMEDDAISLGDNFSALADALGAVTGGWHLGVVTLDDGCLNEGVLHADTPDLAGRFDAAVTTGADVRDAERLFQLVDRALAQAVPGACNAGFLRAGAPLHVVFVSDEPERSTEVAAAWTWTYWLPRFEKAVADPSLLTISGVVDLGGCNEGAAGYLEAIVATGGEALSICGDDWSGHVEALADVTVALARELALTATPDPSTLEVSVDGVASTGWTWNAGAGSVVMDAVEPGQRVEIRYREVAVCP